MGQRQGRAAQPDPAVRVRLRPTLAVQRSPARRPGRRGHPLGDDCAVAAAHRPDPAMLHAGLPRAWSSTTTWARYRAGRGHGPLSSAGTHECRAGQRRRQAPAEHRAGPRGRPAPATQAAVHRPTEDHCPRRARRPSVEVVAARISTADSPRSSQVNSATPRLQLNRPGRVGRLDSRAMHLDLSTPPELA